MIMTRTTRITRRSTSALVYPVVVLLGLLASAGNTGTLPDCPATPNCVSSQASQSERRVAPLQAGSNGTEAAERLALVLNALPRVSWQQQSDGVISAEFTSRLFRFVDDVLLHINDDGVVQIRSASRVGYSDLGANRARVTLLQSKLDALVTD
jgi:uncharacterized protein (DUF1499 family)